MNDNLTKRELEVLKLFAYGVEEIARRLVVTRDTVKTHRNNIIRKLNADFLPRKERFCTNLNARAVLIALKQGLVKLEDFEIGEEK